MTRPMTMADADFMLMLKNYPETRQFSIVSQAEIKKEDHYKWLEQNLADFQVIESDGKAVGAIRIKDYEVSIWIDKDHRKLGIATYILQHKAERGMTAKIVDGNIASMRAFIRADFLPISYSDRTTIVTKLSAHSGLAKNVRGYYIFKKV